MIRKLLGSLSRNFSQEDWLLILMGQKCLFREILTIAIFEYTLSIGFDVSTHRYSLSFSVSAQDTSTKGIAFKH